MYKTSQRWKSNRERRLKKALKQSPNNLQIAEAIKNLSYRRKTPSTGNSWSKTNIRIAGLFKLFSGRASPELFSSNPKVQSAALQERSNIQFKKQEGKVSFSLAARAHTNQGALVWGWLKVT